MPMHLQGSCLYIEAYNMYAYEALNINVHVF